jgi:hypothetical protein
MGAIFISYTGRDAEGVTWGARLNRELGQAQALISLCTSQYDTSP